jgi:hypothetical protein
MNGSEQKVLPFLRLVPKQTEAQSEAQRREAIINCSEAQGAMAACARHLADETALTVTQAIAVLAAGISTYDKAQAAALTATVAKRKLQQRCVDILTSTAASRDMKLAIWLTLETSASAEIAIQVLEQTHEAELTESSHV